jgi:predicted lipoprotein with Yx(FWY)xxD motif
MPRAATTKTRPNPLRVPILALSVALIALFAPAAASAGNGTKVVAAKAQNPTLGETILTNLKGRALYSLSAEKSGRFICTASCLSTWHPLVIKDGVKPRGPVKLGTVERPDGRAQVTFKGRPLYSFSGDSKNGEANGEGIKDVGTWHAASLGKPVAEPQPEPPSPYPYPY